MLVLPSLGFKTWEPRDLRFFTAWGRWLFVIALCLIGVALYLRLALIIDSHNYGMWAGAGFGAFVTLVSMMSIFLCTGIVSLARRFSEFLTYADDDTEVTA